jgi:HEPN domain-containing protein
MNTFIECLPDAQVKQLTDLINRVVTVIAPEKIICYGCRTTIMQDWGCFLDVGGDSPDTVYPTFDLLLIVNENEKRLDHEIIQFVEQQVKPPVSVTCIAHKLIPVNEAIAAGSRFFGTLSRCGVLLYNATRVPLADPPNPPEATIAKINDNWNREYTLAVQFLDAAIRALAAGGSTLTVFLLHQAAEHTFIALIRLYTGYRTNTHSLSRLLAFTGNFTMAPVTVFPCVTKEETELFGILQRGYSDTRYKEGYSVTADKAATLVERIKDLQSIVESLYERKIQSLTTKQDTLFPLGKGDKQ